MKFVLGVFALMASVLASQASAAPSCPNAAASVPLGSTDDLRPTLSVLMNGKQERLIIDTGAPISLIKDSVADELKLPLKPYPRTYVSVAGISPTAIATMETLSVGSLIGHNLTFFLVPSVQIRSADGSFGADFLQGWDVDFDFGNNLLNLVSPDTCAINPVYWTTKPYVSLPLQVTDTQHLRATVKLSGKTVTAMLDTGSADSFMSLALANRLFGISKEGPHIFTALDFGGFGVQRPEVVLGSDIKEDTLVIGIPILKKMHLYISYKNQVAYITAADAN